MSHYRRWYQPGGTYFFTVVTYARQRLFDQPLAREMLGGVLREIRSEQPFITVAMVLLPDHLHAIWTLPPGDDDFSSRWQEIKSRFTRRWIGNDRLEAEVTRAQERRRNRGIWQKRFREHLIDDENELEPVCDYIHYNPVKHGYAARPWDWVASSFRRFVEFGHYEQDWGRSEPGSIGGLDFE